MNGILKFFGALAALSLVVFVVSCGDDDNGGSIIDPGEDEGSFLVADGLYLGGITSSDTTVVVGNKLAASKVEDADFSTKERSGYFTGFMYLEAGDYLFVDINDQEATAGYGASLTEFSDDDADNTDAYTGSYWLMEDISSDPATFSVGAAGYYHVIFDSQTDEAILVAIDDWGIIGDAVFEDACTSNGFNSGLDLEEASADANGASYEASGIMLKGGTFKFRYNDNWKIDRRADPAAGYDDSNGYVVLTNYGGTTGSLEEGAGNISMSDNSIEDGIYDVTYEFDDTGAPSFSLTKTADAEECAFDPANFSWGIIGSATGGLAGESGECDGGTATDGWNTEKDLVYRGQNGSEHKWVGLFPLREGEMKIRTDCTWATKMTPGDDTVPVTITNDTDNITNNASDNPGDGKWIVPADGDGFFYIVITTNDNGANWEMTIDEAEVGVVGQGSPAASWDAADAEAMTYNDDFTTDAGSSASLSFTGTYAGGEWKFLVNNSFDYNLGGTADGSTKLLFDDAAFDTSAGTYNVTLTTDDGGVSYTATVESAQIRK